MSNGVVGTVYLLWDISSLGGKSLVDVFGSEDAAMRQITSDPSKAAWKRERECVELADKWHAYRVEPWDVQG